LQVELEILGITQDFDPFPPAAASVCQRAKFTLCLRGKTRKPSSFPACSGHVCHRAKFTGFGDSAKNKNFARRF
jgi:hypothetical protein